MTDEDVARIIKMKFSPINVSVHTTNPELRVKMMKNKRSGEVLKYLGEFARAGLTICAQIVLCRGINDGAELLRSMRDLAEYAPNISSVAVVPAGLTKFRDKLYPLTDFTSEEARDVIEMINTFGIEHKKKYGTRLVFAADEFYLKAGLPIPDSEYYEDYPQIENGVGMLRSFSDEFGFAAEDVAEMLQEVSGERTVSVATGVASYPMISDMAKRLEAMCPALKVNVYKIINNFFGESITVSGLMTGTDIIAQLSGQELGEELILPANCLRQGEDVFLCGVTLEELEGRLGVKVRLCKNDGYDFVDAVIGIDTDDEEGW